MFNACPPTCPPKIYRRWKPWRRRVYCLKFRKAQVLILSIVFLAVVLILSAALFTNVASFLRFGANSLLREQAVAAADAGIENALWQLNETAGAYTGEVDTLVGQTGTFTVTVTDKGTNLKSITSTGAIPNAASPRAKVTIKVDTLIDTTVIAFNYAVQTGTGGLEMENSSTINGTVYSNGDIVGSGLSQINGEAHAASSISSPDPTVNCPQPTCKFPNASPQPLPTVDYDHWKTQATNGGITDCGGTCLFNGGAPMLDPQKYIGDLTLQNSAAAIMKGPIYVASQSGSGGNVIIKNSASLKLDESFGSQGTVLIADGTITVENDGTILPTNATPKGYILAVTTSTDPNEAILIKNQGVNAILYSLDGGATLQNTAQVTTIVAKKLLIKNSATLNYEQGLASANFSAGPGGSWQIKKGTYRFTKNP